MIISPSLGETSPAATRNESSTSITQRCIAGNLEDRGEGWTEPADFYAMSQRNTTGQPFVTKDELLLVYHVAVQEKDDGPMAGAIFRTGYYRSYQLNS